MSWVGASVAAVGLGQSLIAGGQKRKAEKQLEQLQTPTTSNDSAVSDYYNQARNPTSSMEYRLAQNNANSGVSQGLSAFQDRRSGLAGIGGLLRQRNNMLSQAGASAQSRLGAATQLKAADNERVFNVNKMLPYQKKYSLLAAKAGGQAQVQNAGMSNVFSGLQTMAMGSGGNSLFGKKNGAAGSAGGDPTYYNGNSAGSNYSKFETPTY